MATQLREIQAPAYKADTYAWAAAQIEALRSRRADLLDWDDLAWELADVGHNLHDKAMSGLRIVLLHLLKWDHQPRRRSRSWVNSIANGRDLYTRTLGKNPSLESQNTEMLDEAYHHARREASSEMDVPLRELAADCPFSLDDILTRPIEWDGETA